MKYAQQGRIGVAAHHLGDYLNPCRRRKSTRVKDDISLFFLPVGCSKNRPAFPVWLGDVSLLGCLGPIYSIVYTDVAIHPNGFLAKVTRPDQDIPKALRMHPGSRRQASGGMLWRDYPGPCWPNKSLDANSNRYRNQKSKYGKSFILRVSTLT